MTLRDSVLEKFRFTKCGGITIDSFAASAQRHPICAGKSTLVVLQDGITLVNGSIMEEGLRADCHGSP